ncbi:MAG: hypothetical protein HY360_09040 [Verrucomicrobia bacterium]|nr:hypothetical protein [Verrucomicrobiota bacterium]
MIPYRFQMNNHETQFYDAQMVATAEAYRKRKTTSVLAVVFTDIAQSTELRERLGEIEYENLRELHDQTVRELAERDDAGAVLKSTGDGALAVFAEPSTAVMRCLGIQKLMATQPHFKLRIGIDMGQVSLASKGGIVVDVFGRQVNRAQRIQGLAEPEHILTSFHVYDCAVGWLREPAVSWHNHGGASLRGFSCPVSIHEPFDPQRTRPQSQLHRHESVQPITFGVFNLRPLAVAPKGDPLAYYGIAIEQVIGNLRSAGRDSPSILWVDDYPSNNARPSQLLIHAGCIVDLALTTDEALRRMQSCEYALTITVMGRGQNGTAGIELLQVMRRHSIPTPAVVYCSSSAAAYYGEQATANGALVCTAGTVTLLDTILQVVEHFAKCGTS